MRNILMLVVCALTASFGLGQNIVPNGDFESGAFGPWTVLSAPFVSATILPFDTTWSGPSPCCELTFPGVSAPITLLETQISVVAGTLYEVRWDFAADWVSGSPAGGAAVCECLVNGVSIGSTGAPYVLGQAYPDTKRPGFVWWQAPVTGVVTLQFAFSSSLGQGPAVTGLQLYLDNVDVRVTRTPVVTPFASHAIGSTLPANCLASPFSLVAIFVSLAPAPSPFFVPGARNEVLIDPVSAVLWRFDVVDASGHCRIDSGLPAAASLFPLYWQAMEQQVFGTPQFGWPMTFTFR